MSFPPPPTAPLSREDTFSHKGFRVPDPFAPRRKPGGSFIHAILATALFRCWNTLVFFAAWSTLITVLNEHGHGLVIQPTLLTVIGTVLGFVISYRTTSSFERYNEGRRLWSQIVLASRTFARTTWFHVPDWPATETASADEMKTRSTIEKKTVINLLEAYAVAVKHYLRGEDGIYYQDLYYLVKFLPGYAFPHGLPSNSEPLQDSARSTSSAHPSPTGNSSSVAEKSSLTEQNSAFMNHNYPPAEAGLPSPVTANQKKTKFVDPVSILSQRQSQSSRLASSESQRLVLPKKDEVFLLPAKMPPKYHIFDLFPFSLLVKALTNRGKELKGKKAAKLRAKMKSRIISHNLPLEISLYLSSYIAALQNRKGCDVPTTNSLLGALNQLVDSLTGLERILTTPIPFSYSIHLWVVTVIYCLALPFQIWSALKWITIPATILASFIFFGFLVAGEEIEDPFGYDKNDLNLDHFTHNIIRNELRALTSTLPPDPARWVFVPENNLLFTSGVDERVPPNEWVKLGYAHMERSLSST